MRGRVDRHSSLLHSLRQSADITVGTPLRCQRMNACPALRTVRMLIWFTSTSAGCEITYAIAFATMIVSSAMRLTRVCQGGNSCCVSIQRQIIPPYEGRKPDFGGNPFARCGVLYR